MNEMIFSKSHCNNSIPNWVGTYKLNKQFRRWLVGVKWKLKVQLNLGSRFLHSQISSYFLTSIEYGLSKKDQSIFRFWISPNPGGPLNNFFFFKKGGFKKMSVQCTPGTSYFRPLFQYRISILETWKVCTVRIFSSSFSEV